MATASTARAVDARETFLDVLFRHRGVMLLLLAFPIAYWALDSRAGPSRAAVVLGSAVLAAGVALRLWAVRQIGRSARVARAHASSGLVCSGPYRWTRNPLYLAAGLMLCGFGTLAGGGAWAAALVPAAIAVYTPVVMAEERALERILGAPYERYRERVWRWIGWPGERAASPRVDWREVLRRERWLVPGCLLGAVAVWGIGSRALGVPATLLGVIWLAAAAGNSLHIERKWRRRRHGRAADVSGASRR